MSIERLVVVSRTSSESVIILLLSADKDCDLKLGSAFAFEEYYSSGLFSRNPFNQLKAFRSLQ